MGISSHSQGEGPTGRGMKLREQTAPVLWPQHPGPAEDGLPGCVHLTQPGTGPGVWTLSSHERRGSLRPGAAGADSSGGGRAACRLHTGGQNCPEKFKPMIARLPQAGVYLSVWVGRVAAGAWPADLEPDAYWSLDIVNITLALGSLLTHPSRYARSLNILLICWFVQGVQSLTLTCRLILAGAPVRTHTRPRPGSPGMFAST